VRDEQVRRYARHILLPDVGGLGQTALMVSTAVVDLRSADPAAMVAASFLVAGGVGTVVLLGATDVQVAAITAHNADGKLVVATKPGDIPDGARPVSLPDVPTWWPAREGDDTARAYWRGGLAATTWMADIANR
jgi:hypothetical protein